ncbi:unnamed protein product, partial [Tilletia caries]
CVDRRKNSGAEVLPNGTVATTLSRMASQMRAVMTKLRKTPGTIYFVFHGPVKNHQFPELRIANEQLPEELHSHGRAATLHALAVDDDDDDEEKLADIEIIDSALVFERYIEKPDSVTNADATNHAGGYEAEPGRYVPGVQPLRGRGDRNGQCW